jgi:hypothetical protein
MWAGFALFVIAAVCGLLLDSPPSLETILGVIAAGLACWIAATLP